ncbi:MAG: hypothetical protein R3E96_03140 [Planctomycetota bacterium]
MTAEEHEGDQMAIVINDEIITLPGHQQPPAVAVASSKAAPGDYRATEVNDLIRGDAARVRCIRPDFEAGNRGCDLDSDYVRRGHAGISLALVVVLLFWRCTTAASVYSRACLLFNLVILMGIHGLPLTGHPHPALVWPVSSSPSVWRWTPTS